MSIRKYILFYIGNNNKKKNIINIYNMVMVEYWY